MAEIRFAVPGPDERGYLRRARRALAFREAIESQKGELTAELVDEMVEFLAAFVTEPKGLEARQEALWEASESQFLELLGLVGGTSKNL